MSRSINGHHTNPIVSFIASGGLFAVAKRLSDLGLTWETGAALIGASGTLLFGLAALLKEVRAWRESARTPIRTSAPE